MELSSERPARHIQWPAVTGWGNLGVTTVMITVALAWTISDHQPLIGDQLTASVIGFLASLLAAFVLSRTPGSVFGWLFLLTGFTRAVAALSEAWCVRPLPGATAATWLQAWTALPGLVLAPLIVVFFPDGRLPGRRWRIIPALAAVEFVLLCIVVPAGMWPYRGARLLPTAPVPDTPGAHRIDAALTIGFVLVALTVVAALVSLVLRARTAETQQRQQIKWFGLGAGFAFLFNLAGALPGLAWLRVLGVICVFIGLGFGIFRYRLYDVDRLINRTLVYGALTVLLAGAFAALDVTIALIVGHRSAAVAAISAFVVALLVRPVRDRVQDVVDRLYDRRTYSAVRRLRALGDRVGHQAVEPAQVRDALRAALRDPALDVGYYTRSGRLVDGEGTPFVPAARTEVVRSGPEPVAVLAYDHADLTLLHRVTPAAAVALAHARLQAELQVQLAEVRASRTRLVTAADAERRRIERDLHDGAQQRLVGLAVHIQSTRRRLDPAPDVTELLTFTVAQLQAGVDEIRALVHGILPSTLATSGLAAALADLGRSGNVEVTGELPDRPPPDIEATAWFVACEGVANATKHAPGQPARLTVAATAGALVLRVIDGGPGGADPDGDGLRNLADRVEAHGGVLSVDSRPGAGTTLTAELPCAW